MILSPPTPHHALYKLIKSQPELRRWSRKARKTLLACFLLPRSLLHRTRLFDNCLLLLSLESRLATGSWTSALHPPSRFDLNPR